MRRQHSPLGCGPQSRWRPAQAHSSSVWPEHKPPTPERIILCAIYFRAYYIFVIQILARVRYTLRRHY